MDSNRMARVEANRNLGRRFFAEQDRLQGGPAAELCADNYVARLGGNPPMGREGHQGFAKAFYEAFAGIKHQIERVIADEDGVAVRFRLQGKHTGAFFGIPASGKDVDVVANILLQVRDGKVTELDGIFDEAGLLRQIGVLPTG